MVLWHEGLVLKRYENGCLLTRSSFGTQSTSFSKSRIGDAKLNLRINRRWSCKEQEILSTRRLRQYTRLSCQKMKLACNTKTETNKPSDVPWMPNTRTHRNHFVLIEKSMSVWNGFHLDAKQAQRYFVSKKKNTQTKHLFPPSFHPVLFSAHDLS